jgi:hypothetical protein
VLGVLTHFAPADLAHAFDRGLSDFVRVPFHGKRNVSLPRRGEAAAMWAS